MLGSIGTQLKRLVLDHTQSSNVLECAGDKCRSLRARAAICDVDCDPIRGFRSPCRHYEHGIHSHISASSLTRGSNFNSLLGLLCRKEL